jgi:hypothetical protein
MSNTIEAKLGCKIEQPVPGTPDLGDMDFSVAMPLEDQVAGQWREPAPFLAVCPYCGCVCIIEEFAVKVLCGRCGQLFQT